MIRIAVDAMGGDIGPSVTIPASVALGVASFVAVAALSAELIARRDLIYFGPFYYTSANNWRDIRCWNLSKFFPDGIESFRIAALIVKEKTVKTNDNKKPNLIILFTIIFDFQKEDC